MGFENPSPGELPPYVELPDYLQDVHDRFMVNFSQGGPAAVEQMIADMTLEDEVVDIAADAALAIQKENSAPPMKPVNLPSGWTPPEGDLLASELSLRLSADSLESLSKLEYAKLLARKYITDSDS